MYGNVFKPDIQAIRMHSSSMLTVRCSGRQGGGVVCVGGCLLGGVCLGGCICLALKWGRPPSPPPGTEFLTSACWKHYAFHSYRTVIKQLQQERFFFLQCSISDVSRCHACRWKIRNGRRRKVRRCQREDPTQHALPWQRGMRSRSPRP